MITLYGISNCSTVSKARKWLTENGIDYHFHNFKKEGLDQNILDNWLDILDWEIVLNKRGTTWRKLPEAVKVDMTKDKAYQIMLDNPSIIKRPVININGRLSIGFKENQYQELFKL